MNQRTSPLVTEQSPLVMEHVVKALWMNHRGASMLLSDGDVESATPWFQQGLQIMSKLALPNENLSSAKIPIHKVVSVCADIDTPLANSKGFIYSKAFFFNQGATINERDIHSYTAIMTFNLALSYHLGGLSSNDGGRLLLSAKGLYERTLELLNREWTYDCSNVVIASMNNLACIFSELAIADDAQQVMCLLMLFIREKRVRTDTMSSEDMRDVVLNFSLLRYPSCAGAA